MQKEVLVIGRADNFHFIIQGMDSPASRIRTACGRDKDTSDMYSADHKEDPEKALQDGKRPCMNCVDDLNEIHDIQVLTCELCDRLNIMHSSDFITDNIPYAASGEKQVALCMNCRIRLNKLSY